MLDYEKYIKSISKSLETIASVLSEENKREKAEMKKELENEKQDKKEIEETANEIIQYLEKNPNATKEDIISSLQD